VIRVSGPTLRVGAGVVMVEAEAGYGEIAESYVEIRDRRMETERKMEMGRWAEKREEYR
jgi:hypothetical protein